MLMDHDLVAEQHRLYPHVKFVTAAFHHLHLVWLSAVSKEQLYNCLITYILQ